MLGQAILQFENVTLGLRPPYEAGLENVSFSLGAGELASVLVESGLGGMPLADAAEGLAVPDAGRVVFQGEDWTALKPARAAALRGRIGRVFERFGWVSNLDVDENITLCQRHHSARPPEEIEEEARRWVRMFGLPDLPRVRPALMKRSDLRRAEWARAFLGRPLLVILEEPSRDVPSEGVAALVRAVEEARGWGAGVLWITGDPAAWPKAAATHRLEFKGGRLLSRQKE